MKILAYTLLILFVGLPALAGTVASTIPNAAGVVTAIQQDNDVSAIVSSLEKSRSVKCSALSPANLLDTSPVEATGSGIYQARYFCKDQTIQSNPDEVFQFTIDVEWVREVAGYTTNLKSLEINPAQ